MAAQSFPPVTKGASLLLALKPEQRSVLVIGSGTTAAARVFAALEADSRVVVAGHGGLSSACPEIQWRVNNDEAEWVDLAALIKTSVDEDDPWLTRFGSFLDSIRDLFIVCVTDTMIDSNSPSRRRPRLSAELINRACRARRILVNVTDMPDLCDFIFPACHRFVGERSKKSTNLQLAITTNGRGCRIGTRVRREILARLPKDVGDAVDNVAELRALAKASPVVRDQPFATPDHDCQDEDGISIASPLNKPVPQHAPTATENQDEEINRRMRWVAQISEYWTLGRLAAMTKAEMATLLESYRNRTAEGLDGLPQHATESTQADFTPPRNSISVRSPSALSTSRHHLDVTPLQARRGQILLVGSGPGHPALLTVAAHAALTKKATLILSDKLVPSQVLALIPSSIPVQIAKKFPGNAEGAQNELMELALEGARRGETVVRLKQGDPFLYGRGGEEVLYFRSHGFEPLVIPGVSSALAGPLMAGIPVTQRGVAESLMICTGVGRQGKEVRLPGYERSRTLVILMGVARIAQLLLALTRTGGGTQRGGAAYPPYTPIAVIERASCPDQRVVLSTLEGIEAALERSGEQRPPGMIVIGWSVLALHGTGDLTVLDEGEVEDLDRARITKWLGDIGYLIHNGLKGWGIGDNV